MKLVKLLESFVKYHIKKELEFRFHFIFFLLFDLAWLVLNVFAMVLIFRQAGTVAGWTMQEAILLIFVYYISGSLVKVFVIPGAEALSELVRLGRLDLYLMKPADIRFLVVLGEMQLVEISRFFMMLVLTPWYLDSQMIAVQADQWILFALLVLAASFGLFSIYFSIAALSFWFQNVYSVGDLFRETLDVAKRPVDIFQGMGRNIATFVIPVGLVSSIPTQVLLGKIGWNFLLPTLIAVGVLFTLSYFFFQFALRHYTSSSS